MSIFLIVLVCLVAEFYFATVRVCDETEEAKEVKLHVFPENLHLLDEVAHCSAGTVVCLERLECSAKYSQIKLPAGKLQVFSEYSTPSQEPAISRVRELSRWWADYSKSFGTVSAPAVASSTVQDTRNFFTLSQFRNYKAVVGGDDAGHLLCRWKVGSFLTSNGRVSELMVVDGSIDMGRTVEVELKVWSEHTELFPPENVGRWMIVGPVQRRA